MHLKPNQTSLVVVLLCSIPFVIAAFTLAGWIEGIEPLIHIQRYSPAMQPDTALATLFLAICPLIIRFEKNKALLIVSAAVPLFFGFLALGNFLLQIPAIVPALLHVWIDPSLLAYLALMAPNTALCLIVLSICFLLRLAPYEHPYLFALIKALTSVAALIAGFALAGHLVGFSAAYGWSAMGMSVQTSISVLSLAVSTFILYWLRSPENIYKSRALIFIHGAWAVCTISCTCAILAIVPLSAELEKAHRDKLVAFAGEEAEKLESYLAAGQSLDDLILEDEGTSTLAGPKLQKILRRSNSHDSELSNEKTTQIYLHKGIESITGHEEASDLGTIQEALRLAAKGVYGSLESVGDTPSPKLIAFAPVRGFNWQLILVVEKRHFFLNLVSTVCTVIFLACLLSIGGSWLVTEMLKPFTDRGFDNLNRLQELSNSLEERVAQRTRELKDIERSNRLLLNCSPDVIYRLNTEGKIVNISIACKEAWGYNPEELRGKNHLELVAPGYVEQTASALASLSSGESLGELKVGYLRKDGTIAYSETSASWSEEEQETLCVAHDITEAKNIARRLEESEKMHSALLANLPGMAYRFRIDEPCSIECVSDGCLELTGYEPEEFLKNGRVTFNNLIHVDDRELVRAEMEKALSQRTRFTINYRIVTKEGQEKHVWEQGVGVFSGETLTVVEGYVTDVSERVRSEIALQETIKNLEKTEQQAKAASIAKATFLANMSHEIRTPLTSILGFTELVLAEGLSSEERDKALKSVLSNGQHLLSVINGILDISKIEAGKLEIEILPVQIFDLVRGLEALMALRAKENNISFGIEWEFPIPGTIYTDPTRLKQILLNLCGNAIKFTKQGGVKVQGKFDQEGKKISFVVTDTGVGLREEQKQRLFKAFSQGETSTTRKFGGTGLGLVISAELARLLGGEITVESRPGRGSSFTVTISTGDVEEVRLAYAEPKFFGPITRPAAKMPKLKGKILVAEDGKDNQEFVSLLLSKAGAEFQIVENGAIAIEEAFNDSFDLVLLDMQMPLVDGHMVVKVLRDRGFTQPIIAFTANAMKQDVEQCLAEGCNDIIAKPFSRETFYYTIGRYLGAPSEEAEEEVMTKERVFQMWDSDPESAALYIRFIERLPDRLAKIGEANIKGEQTKLRTLLHQLKGAAAAVCCPNIGNAAKRMEANIVQNRQENIEEDFRTLGQAIDEGLEMVRIYRQSRPQLSSQARLPLA